MVTVIMDLALTFGLMEIQTIGHGRTGISMSVTS